jgi:hypothetical protein
MSRKILGSNDASQQRSLAVPGGACVITKRLPERDGEFEYRIKSVNEPHERVARESQLKTEL